MSSPSASSATKRSETNEQSQPSLRSIDVKPQSGTGANIVLLGPPGSGKTNFY
jgi:DNA replication protein DnaC